MIDYIVAIAHEAAGDRFDALRSTLGDALGGWQLICSRPDIWLYARQGPCSRFEARLLPSGCLIGTDIADEGESWGAYVKVDWSEAGQVTVARDPTGLVPCWRASVPGAEILFSSLPDAASALNLPLEIDWNFVRYHLNAPHSRGRRTGISGVTELLPGWRISVGSGQVNEASWWEPATIARSSFATIEEAQQALRAAAEKAVGGWGRRYDRIALTLSGGLDSAIVLGLLRQCAPKTEIIGVNYLVSHAEGDERSYAEAAARLHGVPLRIEMISPEGLYFDMCEGIGKLRPTSFALPLGYRQARERIASEIKPEAIFSGTGGDHLFYENSSRDVVADAIHARKSIVEIMEIAHQHAGLARETLWTMLAGAIRRGGGRGLSAPAFAATPNAFLTEGAKVGIDWLTFLHPDTAFEIGGIGPAKKRQIVDMLELQGHYWRYSPSFIPDEVHPLMSFPVLEWSLHTPTFWFGYGGIRRGLARLTFADLLPDEIRTRRDKSSNTSHWIEVMVQNLPFLRELMLNGELVRRGFVDRRAMERALTPLSLAGKMDFGGFTTCIATEIWIQQTLAGFGVPAQGSSDVG